MSRLRALNVGEIEQVAGGYYEGDIVVIGHMGDAWSTSVANGAGFGSGGFGGNGRPRDPGGFYADDTFEEGGHYGDGASGGYSEGEYQSIIGDVILTVAEKAWEYYRDKENQKHDREVNLQRSFDPAKVALEKFSIDGNPARIYVMSDGSQYIDRDGNGQMDQHVKFSSDGKLFVDDGDGFRPVP